MHRKMSTSTSSTQSMTPSNPKASKPIRIGSSSSRGSTMSDSSISSGSSPTPNGPCAFPSWKSSPSIPSGPPSSYISDEDLFGDDEVPFLEEAPEPPRTAEQWMAQNHRGMPCLGNASLITLDSSYNSYGSFGSNSGYVPSKPIMMNKST